MPDKTKDNLDEDLSVEDENAEQVSGGRFSKLFSYGKSRGGRAR